MSNPAPTFDAAVAQITALQARDDDTIHDLSTTKFWSHGAKTERALLYLQGYTDSTHQFAPLGKILYERGYNVFAPRLPYHGYKDRMTADHAKLTAPEMVEWANRAVDVALGLGERLVVMGLSLGGVLATWVAEYREEVARAVIIAPAYGSTLIPTRVTRPAAQAFARLPNLFMWWDPRVRENNGVDYAYPRFATHTLAHAFLLGDQLLAQARKRPPAARTVCMVTNANDFAVNNTIAAAFVTAWQAHHTDRVTAFQFPRALGIPHDLLDPVDPAVRPEVVYPRLVELIEKD